MQWIQKYWPKRKEALKVAVLAIAGLTAIHNAVFVPLFPLMRGIASSKVSGLAAMEEPPTLLERSPLGLLDDAQISMGYLASSLAGASQIPPSEQVALRQVAHTSQFNIVVVNPINSADKIRGLAERLGGHLLQSRYSGSDNNYADISISVPVADLSQAEAEIRKLALRVEGENTEAEDVTKEWVDSAARLRNLRATEQQYLQILRRAGSVVDTLTVTGKISEVRSQIEQLQAEFAALAKRVQTVALNVTLRADADVQVLGMHWRPLYRAKLSLRDAVDALGSYGATMFSVALHLPVIALWLFTFFAFAAIGWRLLRWTARVFFGWKMQPKA